MRYCVYNARHHHRNGLASLVLRSHRGIRRRNAHGHGALGGPDPEAKGLQSHHLARSFTIAGASPMGKAGAFFNRSTSGQAASSETWWSILRESKRGNPSRTAAVPQIEAKDCLFLPFTTVVRDNKSVTVVNMDPVMHDIQAYETSHLGARVLFNVPLPMNPQHPRNFRDRGDAALYHKHKAGAPKKELVMLSKDRRVFVMQCGFHAYMESWGLAVSNPYFAKTDEQGRFTITDVPPGTYKLVVWHPYIRTVNEQAVTIGPKGTTEADFAVLAPTGRL